MSDDRSFPVADQSNLIDLAATIVAAYVSKNRVSPAELPALVISTHAAVAGLGSPPAPVEAAPDKPTPAQIRKSVRPDGLVSFIDGKSYKTLKRHLTGNGMTIEQYRERYGLPRDYPSTAASYSEQRSALARSLGLGQARRKAVQPVAETTKAATEAPKPKGKKKAAVAE